MTVYFIGAGPGDPELVTVKGQRLIRTCPVCLYAGSLVPAAVIDCAPDCAQIVDTASLHLAQIMELIYAAADAGKDVARVHSGDPSIYGAIAEQIRHLRAHNIPYEIIPGVPAFAAAAAALGQELTIPEVGQTLIITRTSMKSSGMPAGEELSTLASAGATLAIHLSVRNSREIQRQLIPRYSGSCPSVIAYRVGWPDQMLIRTTLASLHQEIRKAKLTRTALLLIGPVLGSHDFADSALYAKDHVHILRHAKRRQ